MPRRKTCRTCAWGTRFRAFIHPRTTGDLTAARKERRDVLLLKVRRGGTRAREQNSRLPGKVFSVCSSREVAGSTGNPVPFQFCARCGIRVHLEQINLTARYISNGSRNFVLLFSFFILFSGKFGFRKYNGNATAHEKYVQLNPECKEAKRDFIGE